MKIGFIGLGRMGVPMVARLLAGGHEVTVYNRTPGKARAALEQGAKEAQTIADACRDDVVLTMLANDAALETVVLGEGGVLANLLKGAVHISSSTVSVALTDRLSAAHAQAGQRFVAAPVFGRPEAAAAGQLFIVAAGAQDAIDVSMPALEAMGQRTFVIAEKPSAASLVKISGNFLIASMIESLGEAMALVAKGGVDRRAYIELLTSTVFPAPIYKSYGSLIAEQTFEPAGFAASLGQKDIGLALQAAEHLRVPMPLASLLRDRLLALLADGGEALDWTAISKLAARDAGLVAR